MCRPSAIIQAQASNNPAATSPKENLWILDGGTGREIERRGGPFRQPEWSALSLYKNPSIVRDIHKSFIDAGATNITTNTYAIVPFHLGKDRYNKDCRWLLDLATDLAVQAKGDRSDVQVMGSIPPISGSYQPGSFDEDIARPIIHDFLNAFRGKVDSIILETMGSAQEAKFALQQIKQSAINVPVYLSFYVQADENSNGEPRLLTGDTLSGAIELLRQSELLTTEQVPLIMVNCCDIYLVDEALRELSCALANTKFRIGAYPNAFSAPPTSAANVKAREVNQDISPAVLQSMAQKWMRVYGATAVGGCCGIGPDHIRAVANLQKTGQLKLDHASASVAASKSIEAIKTELASARASTSNSIEVANTEARSICCGAQGCGCGVQVGFGQQLPLLCGAVTPSSSK